MSEVNAPPLTIVKFLKARLDEDAARLDLAAEAEAELLRHDGMPDTTAQEVKDYWLRPGRLTEWPRWLDEIEAKRKIVHQYVLLRPFDWPEAFIETLELNLHALALVYSDHPDYRQEWAVGAAGERQST
jgi:hypothetical protein